MYKIYVVRKKDISNCTYNMVDLGLPSGTLWADRNVGASSPEHYGSYFQWGDTNAYTCEVGEITAVELASLLQTLVGGEMEITADNVGTVLEQMMGIVDTDLTKYPSTFGFSDKEFYWDSYFDKSFNKYNNQDGLTVLESTDDAATVHMGSQYRMPTIDEIIEFLNNTTQTFIDVDGNEYIKDTDTINIEEGKLKGVRFTSSNGNSIFIPAAGYCNKSSLGGFGALSKLWSSSLDSDYKNSGSCILDVYHSGNVKEYDSTRYCGLSVRGVQS